MPGNSVWDLLDTLKEKVAMLEVIIVDDGSSDGTGRIADGIARKEPAVKVIHHAQPRGIGCCYRDALSIATGEYFTWFPADGENEAREFLTCLPYLSSSRVVACYHIRADKRSLFRRAISPIYTALINIAFGLGVRYYNGLAIIPRDVLAAMTLTSDGFFFNAENIIRSVKHHGCSIIELEHPLKKERGTIQKRVI